jgi:hypothetical protein
MIVRLSSPGTQGVVVAELFWLSREIDVFSCEAQKDHDARHVMRQGSATCLSF